MSEPEAWTPSLRHGLRRYNRFRAYPALVAFGGGNGRPCIWLA